MLVSAMNFRAVVLRSPLATSRVLPRRGSLRVPGADLHRLPIRIDLAGVSLLEGVRTTIAAGLSLLAETWTGSDLLLVLGVASLIVCFSDVGGPTRQRIPPLLMLSVLGGIAWAGFGMLRGLGLGWTLPAVAICVFANCMARVWGLAGQAVGNVLTVVVVLALDTPLTLDQAAPIALTFMAGGLWAVLLTYVLLCARPYRPTARAVGDVWTMLADLATDLQALLRAQAGGQVIASHDWEAHARVHRRAVRDAIERARTALAANTRVQGATVPQANALLLRLEAAERLFSALIALSDLMEHAPDPTTHQHARRLLRHVIPLLRSFGTGEPTVDPFRLSRVAARLTPGDRGDAAIDHLVRTMSNWIRVALRVQADSDMPGIAFPAEMSPQPTGSAWDALRANLSWRSTILRHAVRVTLVTVPAVAVSLIFWSPYSHWLGFSVALTMQPFFSGTWQRVLERCGGTLLGGLIGGLQAFLPQTTAAHALLLFPLCILGFSARQVSYGAFIACLTPLVVLLFDIALPGHSPLMVAGMRIAYTIAGGTIALAAGLLLWPSWERQRVGDELRNALRAHGDFARTVLHELTGSGPADAIGPARRAAGLAVNNLEASISRALQEPLGAGRKRIRTALLADAVLRRLGGCLIALEHAPRPTDADRAIWAAWAEWLPAALSAPATAPPGPPLPAEDRVRELASRIRLQIETLGELSGGLGLDQRA